MPLFNFKSLRRRTPSMECLEKLQQAHRLPDRQTAASQARAASDAFLAGADEDQLLDRSGRLFKRAAEVPTPSLALAALVRHSVEPNLRAQSPRYVAARTLPLLNAHLGDLIEQGCDNDPHIDEVDADASWDSLKAAMDDSLTMERFAIAHAQGLDLETLRALPEVPLTSAELRLTELGRELELGGLLGIDPTVTPAMRARFVAVSLLFIPYVPRFVETLGLQRRNLEEGGVSAPARAVRLVATCLSSEEVKACQRFAETPAFEKYLAARPALMRTWETLSRSPLVRAAIVVGRQPEDWRATG
jgi:hypothetical protein